ncbi:MAG: hypothetical protein ABI182_03640, partial [Candidatus Baltobacteraceae bacterium]
LAWPITNPGAIEIDPNNNNHILVANLSGGNASSLWVSFDGGGTWTQSGGVPQTGFWYSATISPANGSIVLATNVDPQNNVYVLRSTDGGKTFALVTNVTRAPLTYGRVESPRAVRGEHALAGHRFQPQSIVQSTQPRAFVYSPAREILFNPDVKTGVPDAVLTTRLGAFISTDYGSTWQRIDATTISHSFWRAHWYNGYLYLASDGQGILKSTGIVQPSAR